MERLKSEEVGGKGGGKKTGGGLLLPSPWAAHGGGGAPSAIGFRGQVRLGSCAASSHCCTVLPSATLLPWKAVLRALLVVALSVMRIVRFVSPVCLLLLPCLLSSSPTSESSAEREHVPGSLRLQILVDDCPVDVWWAPWQNYSAVAAHVADFYGRDELAEALQARMAAAAAEARSGERNVTPASWWSFDAVRACGRFFSLASPGASGGLQALHDVHHALVRRGFSAYFAEGFDRRYARAGVSAPLTSWDPDDVADAPRPHDVIIAPEIAYSFDGAGMTALLRDDSPARVYVMLLATASAYTHTASWRASDVARAGGVAWSLGRYAHAFFDAPSRRAPPAVVDLPVDDVWFDLAAAWRLETVAAASRNRSDDGNARMHAAARSRAAAAGLVPAHDARAVVVVDGDGVFGFPREHAALIAALWARHRVVGVTAVNLSRAALARTLGDAALVIDCYFPGPELLHQEGMLFDAWPLLAGGDAGSGSSRLAARDQARAIVRAGDPAASRLPALGGVAARAPSAAALADAAARALERAPTLARALAPRAAALRAQREMFDKSVDRVALSARLHVLAFACAGDDETHALLWAHAASLFYHAPLAALDVWYAPATAPRADTDTTDAGLGKDGDNDNEDDDDDAPPREDSRAFARAWAPLLAALDRAGLGGAPPATFAHAKGEARGDDGVPRRAARFHACASQSACKRARARAFDAQQARLPARARAARGVLAVLSFDGDTLFTRGVDAWVEPAFGALFDARCASARVARGGGGARVGLSVNVSLLASEALVRPDAATVEHAVGAARLRYNCSATLSSDVFASARRWLLRDGELVVGNEEGDDRSAPPASLCEMCRHSPIWREWERWRAVVLDAARWRSCDELCDGATALGGDEILEDFELDAHGMRANVTLAGDDGEQRILALAEDGGEQRIHGQAAWWESQVLLKREDPDPHPMVPVGRAHEAQLPAEGATAFCVRHALAGGACEALRRSIVNRAGGPASTSPSAVAPLTVIALCQLPHREATPVPGHDWLFDVILRDFGPSLQLWRPVQAVGAPTCASPAGDAPQVFAAADDPARVASLATLAVSAPLILLMSSPIVHGVATPLGVARTTASAARELRAYGARAIALLWWLDEFGDTPLSLFNMFDATLLVGDGGRAAPRFETRARVAWLPMGWSDRWAAAAALSDVARDGASASNRSVFVAHVANFNSQWCHMIDLRSSTWTHSGRMCYLSRSRPEAARAIHAFAARNPPQSVFVRANREYAGLANTVAEPQEVAALAPAKFRDVLFGAFVVVCAPGAMDEQFRVYEALDAGAVPIVSAALARRLAALIGGGARSSDGVAPDPLFGDGGTPLPTVASGARGWRDEDELGDVLRRLYALSPCERDALQASVRAWWRRVRDATSAVASRLLRAAASAPRPAATTLQGDGAFTLLLEAEELLRANVVDTASVPTASIADVSGAGVARAMAFLDTVILIARDDAPLRVRALLVRARTRMMRASALANVSFVLARENPQSGGVGESTSAVRMWLSAADDFRAAALATSARAFGSDDVRLASRWPYAHEGYVNEAIALLEAGYVLAATRAACRALAHSPLSTIALELLAESLGSGRGDDDAVELGACLLRVAACADVHVRHARYDARAGVISPFIVPRHALALWLGEHSDGAGGNDDDISDDGSSTTGGSACSRDVVSEWLEGSPCEPRRVCDDACGDLKMMPVLVDGFVEHVSFNRCDDLGAVASDFVWRIPNVQGGNCDKDDRSCVARHVASHMEQILNNLTATGS